MVLGGIANGLMAFFSFTQKDDHNLNDSLIKVSSGKMLLCFGCRLDFTEPGVRLRLFPRGSEMRSCGESICECTLVCLPHAISILFART